MISLKKNKKNLTYILHVIMYFICNYVSNVITWEKLKAYFNIHMTENDLCKESCENESYKTWIM